METVTSRIRSRDKSFNLIKIIRGGNKDVYQQKVFIG